jgi:predicted LPLAT superfamily acyltransferase
MPYALAAKTQCPVAIIFLPRLGHGVFKLHLADIFKAKSNDRQGCQQALNLYVKHLEDIVGKFPYQFFVFFDMWSNESHGNRGTDKAGNNRRPQPGRHESAGYR